MRKRLVVCSDGTWNRPDTENPTNVVKTARAVRPRDDDGRPQIVFYDPGVGTGGGLDHLLGGAFGIGLSRNVMDNYRFLIHNFEEGDEIFLFGFSRGAFTVRSTAGLIRNCGLLEKRHSDRIREAYDLYRSDGFHPRSEEAAAWRERYSRTTRIRFVGVWDTVGALGVPSSPFSRATLKAKHLFHDTELSSTIDAAFHAVSIDERRKPFRPTLWTNRRAEGQRVEQVWFPGVHSNVGGGYPDAGLSDAALLWMMDRAREYGVRFDEEYVGERVRPDPRGRLVDSMTFKFLLFGTHVRRIGRLENGTESLAPAALERRSADLSPPYRPEPLEAYLRERGAPGAHSRT